MKNLLRAMRTGFVDGWDQPFEFSVGMTYEDGTRSGDRRQSAYDRASLIGQRLRRLVAA